jgi:hypothetical protein
MGVNGDQPLVHFGQPVRIVNWSSLSAISAGTLGIGGQHGLERGGIAAGRFLRDIAQPAAARHVDRAAIGLKHRR